MKRIAMLLCVIATMAGCAGVEVKPYDATTYAEHGGIRFYRPQPYVLVTEVKDAAGNVTGNTITIVQFPDLTQEYVMRERGGIGSVTMSPTLTEGWNLTSLATTVDSKVPETITALVGVAHLAIPAAVQMVSTSIKPGLYKLILPTTAGELPTLKGPITFPQ